MDFLFIFTNKSSKFNSGVKYSSLTLARSFSQASRRYKRPAPLASRAEILDHLRLDERGSLENLCSVASYTVAAAALVTHLIHLKHRRETSFGTW